VQQLSLPVPAGHVVIPAPPDAQLGGSAVVVPEQEPPEHTPVEHGHASPHTPLGLQVST
jgi:hypothetical protein